MSRLLLWSALIAGLLCRMFVVFTDDGIYWPDEVYQSLEPAHHLVFGYGFLPWEFLEGARNWALPGLIAVFMQLCALVGADTPETYLRVIRLFFVAMSLITAVGIFWLARRYGASDLGAAAGAAAWALCAPAIYFAHRALGENLAAAAGVWALACLLPPLRHRSSLWLGASLMGLSVLFRLQMGLIAAAVLVVLVGQKRWADTRLVAGVLALWAVAYGALDAMTWSDLDAARYGGWFHSAIVYLRFNLVEGRAAEWGTSPADYYVIHLFRSMPFVATAVAVGLVAGVRRSPGLTAIALLFLGAHSLVAHKEYRFILPFVPLALAAGAIGLDALPGRLRHIGVGALVVAALVSASTFRTLTWGDLGAYQDRADQNAWDDAGPVNRLLLEAHHLPDLCGIRVEGHHAWHGGATYLHREVPFYSDEPEALLKYNYAITSEQAGLPVVARDGNMKLVKLPLAQGCSGQP